MTDPLIAALRVERVGYVNRGLTERIAAVDAELNRLGARPAEPTEQAVATPPEAAINAPTEKPGGGRPSGQRRGRGRPAGETA